MIKVYKDGVLLGGFTCAITPRRGETIYITGVEYSVDNIVYDLTNNVLILHVR